MISKETQERIVNLELVIRSDSSSSESEDEGGSLYAATSVSSSSKSNAKKKNTKQIAQTVKTAKICDEEIWRKPLRVSIALEQ